MPNFSSKHVLQMAKNKKFIKLDVMSEDGGKISFKVKQNVSLSKLRMSYSERVGLPVSSLRFFVNGSRINDQTPEELKMEDGEEVDVFREQGGKSQGKIIKLVVRSEDGGELSVRVNRTASLGNLRKFYSEQCLKLPVSSVRFFVDGKRINDETPDQLEIEDGGVVEVFREQGGKSQEQSNNGDVTEGSAVFPRIQEEKGIPSPTPSTTGSRKLAGRIVFCHIESLRLSSSPELHLTQLAGGCHNPQANVFLPVLPSILPGYLNNYKLGGDIMRTLNLIENKGSYLFRPSVLVENTPGIEYVDEDQALRTFLDFLDMIGPNITLVMKSMIIIV